MKVLYQAEATAIGGRTGSARSNDGQLEVVLATPKSLGGAGGEGTNPEQLFAAGYAACFLGALKYVASIEKVALGEPTITATVGIGPRDDGKGFGLAIGLSIVIPNQPRETAQALVNAADLVCPYSELARQGAAVRLALATK